MLLKWERKKEIAISTKGKNEAFRVAGLFGKLNVIKTFLKYSGEEINSTTKMKIIGYESERSKIVTDFLLKNDNLKLSFSEKTDQAKYNQNVKATTKVVTTLLKKFSKLDELLVAPFQKIQHQAEDAKFDENGKLLSKNQPPCNKLQILRWEEEKLSLLEEIPEKKQKRFIAEIREKIATKL